MVGHPIFRHSADSEHINDSLRQVRRQMSKPFKLPRLFNADGDLTARWFVHYNYINPQTGKSERIKVYKDINQFKTKKERNEYAGYLIKSITELLESGYNPFLLASEQGIGDVHTLAQAIPAYMTVKESQLRGKTLTGYKSILKQFLSWAEKRGHHTRPLKELTADHVQEYFTHARIERSLSATTHNSELTTLRSFFTYWHKKGRINTNPLLDVKRLREEVGLHTVYSDDQIQKITSYLKQQDTPRHTQLLQFIRFLYYTCIRPKEIRMLKVGDIRLQTSTILVPAAASKSGRTEPVDISPGLSELIGEMNLDKADPKWYVFGNQAKGVTGNYSDPRPGPKPVGINYFSDYYREVMKALGMGEEYTLYGWKHTRNVHLWMQEKDLLRLMRHNRHTDPKVTMRYLRSLGLLVDTRITDERRI